MSAPASNRAVTRVTGHEAPAEPWSSSDPGSPKRAVSSGVPAFASEASTDNAPASSKASAQRSASPAVASKHSARYDITWISEMAYGHFRGDAPLARVCGRGAGGEGQVQNISPFHPNP